MNDLERVKKTVKWLISEEVAKNNRQLANILGYTESSFSQILNGKVPLSDKFINKLSILNNRLNEVWLLTGEGEMLKIPTHQNNVNGDNINGENVTVNKTETDKFLSLLAKKDEQIDRLLSLLEKK